MMRHFSIETSSVPDTEYVVINDRLAFRHDISQWLAETRTVIEEHEAEESRLSEDGDGVGASRPTVAGSWGTRHEEAVQVSSEFSQKSPGSFQAMLDILRKIGKILTLGKYHQMHHWEQQHCIANRWRRQTYRILRRRCLSHWTLHRAEIGRVSS